MAYTVDQFREIFPEFAAATYPDARIQFFLDLAYAQLNPRVWGGLLDRAAILLTAHNIAVAPRPSTTAGGANSFVGLATGLVSSKSLGGASVSYDNTTGSEDGAGSYNLTRYGQQFYSLLDSTVVGVAQV